MFFPNFTCPSAADVKDTRAVFTNYPPVMDIYTRATRALDNLRYPDNRNTMATIPRLTTADRDDGTDETGAPRSVSFANPLNIPAGRVRPYYTIKHMYCKHAVAMASMTDYLRCIRAFAAFVADENAKKYTAEAVIGKRKYAGYGINDLWLRYIANLQP